MRRRMTLKRIDPWSVMKFGFVANICLLAIGLLGAAVVWLTIERLELVDKACELALDLGFQQCGINAGNLFRGLIVLGLVGVVIATALLVFFAFLHNLIADMVGGLAVTVAEERVGAAEPVTSRSGPSTRPTAPVAPPRPAEPARAAPAKAPPATGDGDRHPVGWEPADRTTAQVKPPVRSPAESAEQREQLFGRRSDG